MCQVWRSSSDAFTARSDGLGKHKSSGSPLFEAHSLSHMLPTVPSYWTTTCCLSLYLRAIFSTVSSALLRSSLLAKPQRTTRAAGCDNSSLCSAHVHGTTKKNRHKFIVPLQACQPVVCTRRPCSDWKAIELMPRSIRAGHNSVCRLSPPQAWGTRPIPAMLSPIFFERYS